MTHTALITPTRRFALAAVNPINPINLAILLCIWPQPKDTFIASISWLNLASTFSRWTSIDTRPKTWRPYTIGTTFCATWTRPPLSWSSPISRKNEFCLFNLFFLSNSIYARRKKCKSYKERAEKNCEKRIQEFNKRQAKLDASLEMDYNREMPHRPSTALLSDWKQRLWSSSQGSLKPMTSANRDTISAAAGGSGGGGTKFSALVGGTISGPRGTVQRKAAASKAARLQNNGGGGDFKVREIEASGKRSVSSLQGLQRDSEVMYVGTFGTSSATDGAGRRGKLTNVFSVDEEPEDGAANSDGGESTATITRASAGTMSRSFSQPDFLAGGADEVSEEVMLQRPSGLFDRPMLGSLAFR